MDNFNKISSLLSQHFEVNLNIFTAIPCEPQDKSVLKAKNVVEKLDPMALLCLYEAAMLTKSSAISLCLLHDHLSLSEAVSSARVDEDAQIAKYGKVDGAHDIEEAKLRATLSAAYDIVKLCRQRNE